MVEAVAHTVKVTHMVAIVRVTLAFLIIKKHSYKVKTHD